MALTLSACGTTKWGFPYRADVQQGNWITAEQVAQLKKGMTREQVRFILGTPTLQDIFRSNRWDYPYVNKPGYGKVQERKFTVWFDGDVLDRWEGDPQPDRQPFQKADTGMQQPDAEKDKETNASRDKPDAETSAKKRTGPLHNLNAEPRPVPGAPSALPSSPQPLR